MAAGIAHEVRNPLSAIKGLARFFMEASPEGSDESRMADIMTREVLRLTRWWAISSILRAPMC